LLFEFFRFRFRFVAADELYFPPYKSGNTVRGAFGSIFRRLTCRPECEDAKKCEERAACAYARIFEPRAARGEGPSGLADWPRPFVFRASHLDGLTLREGEEFHFDIHSFDVRDPALRHFVAAFAELAHEGIGPARGRAELIGVEPLDMRGAALIQSAHEAPPPIVVDLSAGGAASRIGVRFVTPTELKSEREIALRPEFGVLFARLRDRISALRTLYGSGSLEIDFRKMGERAAAVRMTRCELSQTKASRRSSRTGQTHPLGGFVGEAEYEGEVGEFLPYLRLGQWTGVGRHTVWGNGELKLTEVALS
jgi:hypothetical protein